MSDIADLSTIKQTIYAPGVDVSYRNGTVLIGKLPGGPLQFLHKLFNPTDHTIQEVERILGFAIPDSYAHLFTFSDGATLFDNTLFLFGVKGATSREVSINNVRPVSLADQVDSQRSIDPWQYRVGVGSIAAATKTYTIQIEPSGTTALCSEDGQKREYPAFLSMLVVLVQILADNSGQHGLLDPTAETLQYEIDQFIAAARQ